MLEQTKKFTFSVDKSELIHMKFTKGKKKEESTTITVKKGQIKRVSESKYLREYFNDRGDNKTRIQKKMNKVALAIAVAKACGSESKVGKEAMKVRLQILETVIMPSVTYGMETWTNLSKKDKEEIEKIHKELITSLFELAKSTPYWGIIAETAI